MDIRHLTDDMIRGLVLAPSGNDRYEIYDASEESLGISPTNALAVKSVFKRDSDRCRLEDFEKRDDDGMSGSRRQRSLASAKLQRQFPPSVG
jgi:hypothetical protein